MPIPNGGLITETNQQYYEGAQGFVSQTGAVGEFFNATFNTDLIFGSFDPAVINYALNNFKIYTSANGFPGTYAEYILAYTVIGNRITFTAALTAGTYIVVQLKILTGGKYGLTEAEKAFGQTVEDNYQSYAYNNLGDIINNLPNGRGIMFHPTKSNKVGFWKDGRFLTGSSIDSKNIIELTKDGGSYLIDVKLNGMPVNNMIFDTGAELISLSASYLGPLFENGTITESDIVGDMAFLDASGNINSKLVINIKELIIGSVVIKNVKASICEECMLKGINLLGLNAIKGLGNIYIDFEKDRIILNRAIN